MTGLTTTIRSALSGRKTIITGLVTIALGAVKLAMPELPIEGDPTVLITNGLAMIFLRKGIAKVAK